MRDINEVRLRGRLGQEPEIRHTAGGKVVASLSLATGESWKDKSGEWQQKSEWHRLIAWDKLAEAAGELRKGDAIQVQGKLQTRKWQDRDGSDRWTTEIQVLDLVKVESVRAPQNESRGSSPQPPPAGIEDDIPF